MAVTNTWSIVQCEYVLSESGLTNVINLLHWRLNAEETDNEVTYHASSYGTQNLGDPDPENYTPYADVSESDCISWLHAEMGEEQVQSLLDSVAANIELQKNPVDGHGTPWSE
jgi:hypothetical protein